MCPTIPLYELASSYWKSASLQAALDLKLFEALGDQVRSVEHLSGDLSCDTGSLRALLDALTGLNLLTKTEEGYCISEENRPYLNPASEHSLLSAFSFNQDLQRLWDGLANSVRTGQPVMPESPHLGSDPERMRRFVAGMHSRAGLMARGLMQVVEPESGSRILDLAGGPGTFSLRLVQRDPSLSISVMDLPPVVQAAQHIHKDHPQVSSLQFVGADYHKDELPTGYDMVFYCGAVHQELPEQVPALLRKVRDSLTPKGTLLVVDLMLDDDRTQPVYSALFDLNMRLMRPTSHVHTVTELKQAMHEAGFHPFRSGDVPHTPYRFIEATCSTL